MKLLESLKAIETGKMKRAVIVFELHNGDTLMESTSTHIDSLGLLRWGTIAIEEAIGSGIQNRAVMKPALPPGPKDN